MLLTVNCWIFGLPISPFKKAAATEYVGHCAFAEQGSSNDPSDHLRHDRMMSVFLWQTAAPKFGGSENQLHKLWNPLIVLPSWWKNPGPAMSFPTGAPNRLWLHRSRPAWPRDPENQCEFLVLVEAPSNKNKTWSIWIVVSWGFDLHPVVWLVNRNLTHSTSHWSPKTNRRMYNESRQN